MKPHASRSRTSIVQERLTAVTKRNVQSLVGNNTLAWVANCADQIRPELVFSTLRGGQDRVRVFKRVLGDKKASRDDRIEALRFIVHLVGDIHQPFLSPEKSSTVAVAN